MNATEKKNGSKGKSENDWWSWLVLMARGGGVVFVVIDVNSSAIIPILFTEQLCESQRTHIVATQRNSN